MILVWEFCALLLVSVVNSQREIWFENEQEVLTNNSYIYYTSISDGDDALKCVTTIPYCCTDSDDGDWRDETGIVVHQGPDDSSCLYVTRGPGEISLNRNSDCIPDTSGLWRCDIADPDDEIQSIYIYISNDNTSGNETKLCYILFTRIHCYRFYTDTPLKFSSAH